MKFDKFITRPVLSSAISVFIVVLGVLGLVSLPTTQYPSIAPPTVQVEATYTGANAPTVLNSVVSPLEEEINGVEGMTYMTSTATNTGKATILIYFEPDTDPDMDAINVQNRISQAEGSLPSEVTKIGVTATKRQSSILMTWGLYSENDQYDYAFLENYADINLIPQIKRIKGVSDVFITGSTYSMRIWLKPDVMAQYHLMPSDITTVLDEQNIEAAPGQLGEQGNQSFQYVLKYKGRLETVEEFEDIVISATKDGEVLHLKDVADIELGRLSNSVTASINGHPGVTGMVFQTAGSNAMDINNSIEEFLIKAEADFPEGVKYAIMMNTNNFLYASIWEVVKTLLEAFLLVILVTYIFLQNTRSTLIPTIAIPVALVGSFFLMWAFGFSVNLLTLCAMVLAIGTVVDDAIIVVEAVQAKIDTGYTSARQASLDAMGEISSAIISSTLVMMAIFIPVSFTGGTSGVFFKQMGLTMAFAIGISGINALTLSPALCAILLKPGTKDGDQKLSFAQRFHDSFNDNFKRLTNKYKKGVSFFTGHKLLSGSLVGIVIITFVFLLRITPTGLIPNEDQELFLVLFLCLWAPP